MLCARRDSVQLHPNRASNYVECRATIQLRINSSDAKECCRICELLCFAGHLTLQENGQADIGIKHYRKTAQYCGGRLGRKHWEGSTGKEVLGRTTRSWVQALAPAIAKYLVQCWALAIQARASQ